MILRTMMRLSYIDGRRGFGHRRSLIGPTRLVAVEPASSAAPVAGISETDFQSESSAALSSVNVKAFWLLLLLVSHVKSVHVPFLSRQVELPCKQYLSSTVSELEADYGFFFSALDNACTCSQIFFLQATLSAQVGPCSILECRVLHLF